LSLYKVDVSEELERRSISVRPFFGQQDVGCWFAQQSENVQTGV
jgi:hypothetical protein